MRLLQIVSAVIGFLSLTVACLAADSRDLDTAQSSNGLPFSLSGSRYGPWNPSQPALHFGQTPAPAPLHGCPAAPLDPYLLHLLAHYMRYLPYGLGPYGFYGSTGLPQPKPPGLTRSVDKIDKLPF